MSYKTEGVFPGAWIEFGSDERNNLDVVDASHVNTIRAEVWAIQKFLEGNPILVRPKDLAWSGADSPTPGGPDKFTTLKGRLDWLDAGLLQHRHDDLYVKLSGGSVIKPQGDIDGLVIQARTVPPTPGDNPRSSLRFIDIKNFTTMHLEAEDGSVNAMVGRFRQTDQNNGHPTVIVHRFGGTSRPALAVVDSTDAVLSSLNSDGGLYMGKSHFRAASTLLKLDLPVADTGIQVISSGDGTILSGIKGGASTVSLTLSGLLTLNKVSIDGTASTATFTSAAYTDLYFKNNNGVINGSLRAEYKNSSPNGGALNINFAEVNLRGVTRLHGRVEFSDYPVVYANLEQGWIRNDDKRTLSNIGSLLKDKTLEFDRAGNFLDFHTYQGGAKDPEKAKDTYFKANPYEIRFTAPPSGTMHLSLSALMYGRNSSVALGWELKDITGKVHAVNYRGSTVEFSPAYERGVFWYEFTNTDVSDDALPNDKRSKQTVSNGFLLYQLVPGMEYTLTIRGAFLSRTLAHRWCRIDHVRAELTPVYGRV